MLKEPNYFEDVMLDLETVGIRANCVVLSIGAVYFNAEKLGPEFYTVLNTDDQQAVGRQVEQQALEWWAKQSQEAQKVFNEPQVPALAGLERFAKFLGNKNIHVWGNGASFDNIVLYSLYQDFGLKTPWNFTNDRCFRTIKNLFIADGLPPRYGTYHNALDDAKYQAICMQRYLKGTLKWS